MLAYIQTLHDTHGLPCEQVKEKERENTREVKFNMTHIHTTYINAHVMASLSQERKLASLSAPGRERARSQERRRKKNLVLLPLSLFPPSPQVVVTYFLSYFFSQVKSSQSSEEASCSTTFFCP